LQRGRVIRRRIAPQFAHPLHGTVHALVQRVRIMDRVGSVARSAFGFVRALILAGGILALLAAVPYALLWLLFWSASGSWDMEGTGSLRHWLLVKGSLLDRLGVVAQTDKPARYSVRFQEGTFPGWRVAGYESSAVPEQVVATYARRCTAFGLRVIKRPPADGPGANGEALILECEIEPYLDVQVFAERKVSATVTEVSMRVWGSR
jgi:hypothetical protein